MKTIKLYTCNSEPEAHLIKARLANEGIDCILANGNFTTLMPMYNDMLGGGVQVLVCQSEFEAAKEIIKDKIDPASEEIICPHCGSNEIGIGLGDMRYAKILFILIAILSAMPIGNIKSRYYCRKCKEEIK